VASLPLAKTHIQNRTTRGYPMKPTQNALTPTELANQIRQRHLVALFVRMVNGIFSGNIEKSTKTAKPSAR
jgi:hypothetical protein